MFACLEASSMAAGKWASSNNNHKSSYKGVNENDMVMGHFLFQKSGIIGNDFMQNCDLPPPLKVFSGPDKTVLSSMNRVCGIMGEEQDDDADYDDDCYYEFDVYRSDEHEREKPELLKALRLSQNSAREAERRAASLAKERDCISKAFFEDSLRLLAYRQWMRLLDVQVSKLQSQFRKKQEQDDSGDDGIDVSWFVALAFCLGIVGGGFALGCRFLL